MALVGPPLAWNCKQRLPESQSEQGVGRVGRLGGQEGLEPFPSGGEILAGQSGIRQLQDRLALTFQRDARGEIPAVGGLGCGWLSRLGPESPGAGGGLGAAIDRTVLTQGFQPCIRCLGGGFQLAGFLLNPGEDQEPGRLVGGRLRQRFGLGQHGDGGFPVLECAEGLHLDPQAAEEDVGRCSRSQLAGEGALRGVQHRHRSGSIADLQQALGLADGGDAGSQVRRVLAHVLGEGGGGGGRFVLGKLRFGPGEEATLSDIGLER